MSAAPACRTMCLKMESMKCTMSAESRLYKVLVQCFTVSLPLADTFLKECTLPSIVKIPALYSALALILSFLPLTEICINHLTEKHLIPCLYLSTLSDVAEYAPHLKLLLTFLAVLLSFLGSIHPP